ncbi:MAG: hypothetical protein M1828_007052 [Chrysothrix sp. TS-e1954]|nr:MAG: hypothetical protein M1828_007052 [Chrysothrix sp. TS-e1954]
MSSSNINNPVGTYPSEMGQDLPPNNDARLEKQDNDPSMTSNPVKMSSGGVSQGTSSVGKEGTEEHGHAGRSEMGSADPDSKEKKKGLGEKIKEKLKG